MARRLSISRENDTIDLRLHWRTCHDRFRNAILHGFSHLEILSPKNDRASIHHARSTTKFRSILTPVLEIRVPLIERLRSLLSDVGKEGAVSGWKFSLLANVFLIILLPLDRSQSVEILEHFFTIFLSALPHLTAIALQGIYALIRPVIDQDHSSETPLAQYVFQSCFERTECEFR